MSDPIEAFLAPLTERRRLIYSALPRETLVAIAVAAAAAGAAEAPPDELEGLNADAVPSPPLSAPTRRRWLPPPRPRPASAAAAVCVGGAASGSATSGMASRMGAAAAARTAVLGSRNAARSGARAHAQAQRIDESDAFGDGLLVPSSGRKRALSPRELQRRPVGPADAAVHRPEARTALLFCSDPERSLR